jgi:hypothetical protein
MRCHPGADDCRTPGFCRSGACVAGCDFAIDCPRPGPCESVQCAQNTCLVFKHEDGATCVVNDHFGECSEGICRFD